MEGNSSNCPPPAGDQVHPRLLIRHGLKSERQTFYDQFEDEYHSKPVPDMRNKRVIPSSSQEWLLLVDCDSEECLLWNSISKEKIQIPSGWAISSAECCFLTSSPVHDPRCKIILLMNSLPLMFWYCQIGETRYKEVFFEVFSSSVAMYKGELYLATIGYGLKKVNFKCEDGKADTRGEIDLVPVGMANLVLYSEEGEQERVELTDPELQIETVLSDGDWPTYAVSHQKDYLLESGDDLLIICRMGGTSLCPKLSEFVTYRMNFSSMKWEPLMSIGARTILLSTYRSITYFPNGDDDSRVKANSIYYAHAVDGRMFIYDFEDQSISTLLPCRNITRRPRQSFLEWVVM